jgi:6-pyruvoyltetrahydropterin/6-carboxytetrahydropterin synthase
MESQTLAIDGWRAGLRFSACHILPEHPKCSRMHGHTYAVHLRITGTPGDDGLVLDFTRIKAMVRELTEELDHRLLIPEADPRIDLLVKEGYVRFRYGGKGYSIPEEDVMLLPVDALSGERLSAYLLERFVGKLGDAPNITAIELGLDEGPGQGAWSRWAPGDGEGGGVDPGR